MKFWKKEPEEPTTPPVYTPEEEARLEAALEKGHRLGEDGEWPVMAEHLEGALEEFADDPALLCWLGVAEREMGLESQAYERFRAVVAAQPRDAHVLSTAGNALAAFDDPAAEAALRTATVLAPELASARWLYGAYLIREGLVEEGLQELQAARNLEPDNAEITYELGVALALQGNHEGAADEFHRAAELGGDEGWLRVVMGLALLEERRLDEALTELVAGARARPDDVQAQFLAALAAAAEAMPDLAWEMLERGRQGAIGTDVALAEEIEGLVDEDAEEVLEVLIGNLAPAAYRERLAERP